MVMTSINVFVELLIKEIPDSKCPTTSVFEFAS